MMLNKYNPDVLSCLANLSNDEVFTPPEVVNRMLDMLPQELFESSETTFLDPCCKSGVFLREIAKRLLKNQMPGYEEAIEEINRKKSADEKLSPEDKFFESELQKTVDHIFHKQLFGIAITEMTSLLSRRSVYCTKHPDSEYSISKFDRGDGNIRFKKIQHTWVDGKCKFCGANMDQYSRAEELESHAYEWIHTVNPEGIFDMKFDVIIGNPPYQLSDGGGMGAAASPIYQLFVNQAKKLKPRFLEMIIPSRWFSGGRNLDDFRNEMLHDNHIRVLHDYLDASDCFPGVEIKGGVCYFRWDRDSEGKCKIVTHEHNGVEIETERKLLEDGLDTFLRQAQQISVYKKVIALKEKSFMDLVSANDPYGYDVREEGGWRRVKPNYELKPFKNSVKFYYNGWRKDGIGFVDKTSVRKGLELISKYKIFVPKAWGTGIAATDWLNSFVVEKNSVSTETYLTVGPFANREEAENAQSYIQTRFFHFMVSMKKITQNTMKNVYQLVPQQDFSKSWTDAELYEKYKLTKGEIDFIESMIRPMDKEDA